MAIDNLEQLIAAVTSNPEFMSPEALPVPVSPAQVLPVAAGANAARPAPRVAPSQVAPVAAAESALQGLGALPPIDVTSILPVGEGTVAERGPVQPEAISSWRKFIDNVAEDPALQVALLQIIGGGFIPAEYGESPQRVFFGNMNNALNQYMQTKMQQGQLQQRENEMLQEAADRDDDRAYKRAMLELQQEEMNTERSLHGLKGEAIAADTDYRKAAAENMRADSELARFRIANPDYFSYGRGRYGGGGKVTDQQRAVQAYMDHYGVSEAEALNLYFRSKNAPVAAMKAAEGEFVDPDMSQRYLQNLDAFQRGPTLNQQEMKLYNEMPAELRAVVEEGIARNPDKAPLYIRRAINEHYGLGK